MKRLRVWLILACLCTSCMGLIDFDYYWQADLGRYELLFGDFNRCYSQVWGVTSGTYLDHEWLCNIFFYVFSGFGEYSVLITKMVMALIIGAGIVFALRGYSLNGTQESLVLAAVLTFSLVFFKVKAYSFSVLFLLLELQALREKKYNLLWLCILWANTHSGSVVLFIGVYGAYVLFNRFQGIRGFIISSLGILINPYGFSLVVFNLRHALDGTMGMVITDWDCLDAGTGLGILVLIVMIAVFYLNRGYERFISCVFIFMSLVNARHAIYLFPLLILGIASHDFEHDFRFSRWYVSISLAWVLILSLFSFNPKQFNLDVMPEELEELLLEAPDSTGLFTSAVDVIHLGIQPFTTGAYPMHPDRMQDTLTLLSFGSSQEIKAIIDHYGLTRFVFCKWNEKCEYYQIENPLYGYLSGNPGYECLYDSDGLCYFVTR